MGENYLVNISNIEKERAICKQIMHIAIVHRRAMELVLCICVCRKYYILFKENINLFFPYF